MTQPIDSWAADVAEREWTRFVDWILQLPAPPPCYGRGDDLAPLPMPRRPKDPYLVISGERTDEGCDVWCWDIRDESPDGLVEIRHRILRSFRSGRDLNTWIDSGRARRELDYRRARARDPRVITPIDEVAAHATGESQMRAIKVSLGRE